VTRPARRRPCLGRLPFITLGERRATCDRLRLEWPAFVVLRKELRQSIGDFRQANPTLRSKRNKMLPTPLDPAPLDAFGMPLTDWNLDFVRRRPRRRCVVCPHHACGGNMLAAANGILRQRVGNDKVAKVLSIAAGVDVGDAYY
jgi:hypothetical protein